VACGNESFIMKMLSRGPLIGSRPVMALANETYMCKGVQ
jgi:hypothetical protein